MTRIPIEQQRVNEIIRQLPRRTAVAVPGEVELVDFDPAGPAFLAVASDSVCEEVSTGLYSDPYTVGWVLIMAPASDMAAAAADMLGLTTMLALPHGFGPEERTELARGIGEACRALGTVTLGGDTSVSRELVASACAIGLVPKDQVMSRKGATAGDVVYLSGEAGLGNAYALSRFDRANSRQAFPFRPSARIELRDILRRYASSTMDTSDGVMATLDELARVNGVGITLTAEPESVLHLRAVEECRRRRLPAWVALAGCHGEFEIAFTVPASLEPELTREAQERGLHPRRLGQVTDEPGIVLAWDGQPTPIDTTWLRDRATDAATDVRSYIEAIAQYAEKVGK